MVGIIINIINNHTDDNNEVFNDINQYVYSRVYRRHVNPDNEIVVCHFLMSIL